MNYSDENHEALHRVLKEWRTDTALPPRFQQNVWHRIERLRTSPEAGVWSVVRTWIANVVPRPAFAATYVALLLTVAGTTGWMQGQQTVEQVRDELGQRYVRVLDPYQAPRR